VCCSVLTVLLRLNIMVLECVDRDLIFLVVVWVLNFRVAVCCSVLQCVDRCVDSVLCLDIMVLECVDRDLIFLVVV